MTDATGPLTLGRYTLHGEIAHGGMATVHLARLQGPVGFSRTVAIKRLHPQFAKDPEFVTMFLDEARLAVRIQHPNVAQTLDVVAESGELFIVMEYLHGETASRLLRATGKPFPPEVAAAVMIGALHGLHAAHEAKNERGEPLQIVHRDVSPQNVFVGRDGIARVLDFGVAKAAGRFHTTEEGKVKGKLPYMSPEQVRGEPLTRATDIYAASVVAWELLVGERFIRGQNAGEVVERVLYGKAEAPSKKVSSVPPALDAIVLRGLARDPAARWATAREMALALEAAITPAQPSRVGAFVEASVGGDLEARASRVAEAESTSNSSEMHALLDDLARSGGPGSTAAAAQISPRELVTSPGTASDTSAAPRRRRPALWVVAAAALVGVGFASRGLVSREVTTPAPKASAAPAVALPTTSVAAAPEAEPSTAQSPSALPSASTSPSPLPGATIRPVPVPVPRAASKPKADCNPPWTLDSSGRKKYKLECL